MQRLLPLLPAALLALPAAADVHRVDADGSADFETIQEAVDAAGPGDTILVLPGEYAGFSVVGKPLTVAADAGGAVALRGQVQIADIALTEAFLLSGVDVVGETRSGAGEVALILTGCLGSVRLEGCSFRGGIDDPGAGCHPFASGADAALVTGSTAVVFAHCTLTGGAGMMDCECGDYDCQGGVGGDGCEADLSSIAFYDCVVQGGAGGIAALQGGRGGSGYRSLNFGLLASGCTFRGGAGGNAFDFIVAFGGDGGHGLQMGTPVQAHLLDNVVEGGPGGQSFINPQWNGQDGQDIVGGTNTFYSGAARHFRADSFTADNTLLSVAVTGTPGDRVYLPRSFETNFHFLQAFSGVWLVPYPARMPVDPLGVIPASGSLTVQVPVEELAPGTAVRRIFMQGYVLNVNGVPVLGDPLAVLAVNCDVLNPDCDGNGSYDGCDIVGGAISDCDADGVPDSCEADCNLNGVNDECDLSSGTSPDANSNGVPDECEPSNQTWYVDAGAAFSGDGSSASPFKSIGEAVSIALGGDSVRVRPGLYTGPDNRNMDFAGRQLRVTSTSGSAATIIDLGGQGRAFLCRSQETAASRIGGFTIRNGNASLSSWGQANGGGISLWNADTTIINCVIESCHAAANGGGIYLFNSDALVQGCTVRYCDVGPSANAGGGVYAAYKTPRLIGCTIQGNYSANVGGGVHGVPIVSHCRILENVAGSFGGGMYVANVVSNCLLAGNSAQEGGAIAGYGNLQLWNSTVTHNTATVQGGAIHRGWSGMGTVGNSVVWFNSAPTGPQIVLAHDAQPSSLTVEYSNVEGGQAAVFLEGSSVLTWGPGNQNVDPLFVDVDGPDDVLGTHLDNDLRLSAGSVCLDAGDNALLPRDELDLDGDGNTTEGVPFDVAIRTRRVDDPAPDTGAGAPPLVDIGAHERQ